MSKLTILAAASAGYVLGARAGRQRYEQIASNARKVMGHPRVQAATQQARHVATEQAAAAGAVVADRAKEAASAAVDKVRHSSDETSTPTGGSVNTGANTRSTP